jgi:hypothetical protein
MRVLISLFFTLCTLVLVGCGTTEVTPEDDLKNKREYRYDRLGKFFGEDALYFGEDDQKDLPDAGITVNAYLWRATLDTLNFMPLKQVDPFGGVILTSWHSQTPSERVKVNVRVLTRSLRADGIKVSIFKQKRSGNQWIDLAVSPQTVQQLEDTILTRARQLKLQESRK